MPKKEREKPMSRKRTRDELAEHFMQLRLQASEQKAQEYQETLDPRQR